MSLSGHSKTASGTNGYLELAELEHRLWAANQVVQDTRFRATCAMSGQLAAAEQRSLGTDLGATDPVTSFLAPELHFAPYPFAYPRQQGSSTTENKGTPPLQGTSRAKRPRELPMQCHDTMRAQRCDPSSSFPCLPEDLYSDNHQSSQLASTTRKHTRSSRYSFSALEDRELFGHHSQPDVQRHAAIAAFRPEEFTPASSQQQPQWDSRRPHLAPAVLDSFPSGADGVCFAAALSACAESLRSQQQADRVVALPFPGMHTLDLAFPLAQSALLEAGQQLLERPREFQAALTRCPLSQAEIKHAVIAADGYTYDALHIVHWRVQHPAVMGMTSPLTRRPLTDRRLADNSSLQSLLQAVAAQRLRPL